MKNRITRLLLIFCVFPSVLTASAHAQCSYCTCRSSRDYLPDQGGGGCANSACTYVCAIPVKPAAGPGFTAKYTSGGFRVTSVLAFSPAEQAGVRVGDVLTAIDGHALPLTCSKFYNHSEFHSYTVLRNNDQVSLSMGSDSLIRLQANATLAKASVAPPADYSASNRR